MATQRFPDRKTGFGEREILPFGQNDKGELSYTSIIAE